jgi:hypothetical protein
MSITDLIISSAIAATMTTSPVGSSRLPGLVTSPVRAGRQMADQ